MNHIAAILKPGGRVASPYPRKDGSTPQGRCVLIDGVRLCALVEWDAEAGLPARRTWHSLATKERLRIVLIGRPGGAG